MEKYMMDKALLEKALERPPNERVVLAELILASIDYEEDEIRRSWFIEVQSRMNAVHEGRAKLLDFEELYHES
jgi:putative addiction module component (TIGR02574 family)